ncbi:4,5-DOPA-extradiol-dioxygenase [Deminuibacter soli]|uniref:4,5-DOPA dioxygenase extradiol n=1 Tax=Deminuibacter soli TaxID=2291815 RepID=A0A3E1NDX8_9BACT|nr:4,5-DOPA dioxygenase extradiol [Deminuibacter soli]RFM26160.1 4,5-DOPA dioxygenase extradiol [Deminuibacter soli]
MNTLSDFRKFTRDLPYYPKAMPVLFVGHGSPMNGIEHNMFSDKWATLAQTIPVPAAVLVISAHWFTQGTKITAMEQPPTIHDFGGFPKALFDVQYPAPGNPQLAADTAAGIASAKVELSHDWGLDHGTWTVVRHMYPQANIPVLQLSIDYTKDAARHYELARELYHLRSKGVLIIGSGNMVHNLRMLSWEMINGGGYDWAIEINEVFKQHISTHNHADLIHYSRLGTPGKLAIPTPEHYLPLLYTLGLQSARDEISFFNDEAVGGSLTMTSVQIGEPV